MADVSVIHSAVCKICTSIESGSLADIKKYLRDEEDIISMCTCSQAVYKLIKWYKQFLNGAQEDNMLKSDVWRCPHIYYSVTRRDILEITAQILAVGMGVNYATGEETPLMAAITTYDESLLGMLLDFGADVNLQDGSEEITALGLAILLNEGSLVEMLLKHGGSVNAPCCGHLVPIQLAMNKDPAVSNILLQYGADLRFLHTISPGSELFTVHCPLVIAIVRKNAYLAMILLEHGEDVNQGYGDSLEAPIHLAIREDDINMVNVLIHFGADLNKTSTEGHTPLGLALSLNKPNGTEIAKNLVRAGASLNKKTIICYFQKIYTPLHIACFKGNFEFIKFLVEEASVQDDDVPAEVKGMNKTLVLKDTNNIETNVWPLQSIRYTRLCTEEVVMQMDRDVLAHTGQGTTQEGIIQLTHSANLINNERHRLKTENTLTTSVPSSRDIKPQSRRPVRSCLNQPSPADSDSTHQPVSKEVKEISEIIAASASEVFSSVHSSRYLHENALFSGPQQSHIEDTFNGKSDDNSHQPPATIEPQGYVSSLPYSSRSVQRGLEHPVTDTSSFACARNISDGDAILSIVQSSVISDPVDDSDNAQHHPTATSITDLSTCTIGPQESEESIRNSHEPVFQQEFGASDSSIDVNFAKQKTLSASVGLTVQRLCKSKQNDEHITKENSARRHKRLIRFLNQKTVDGSTPLFMAVFHGDTQIVSYLLDAGANHNFACSHGNFFHAAVLSQNVDLILEALKLGCDINHVNAFGNTPLILVSRLDLPEACNILIANGANIDACDRFGETALLGSVYFGYERNARILIQHGAALNHMDDNNTSAVYWAIFNSQVRTLKLLLLAGAHLTLEVLSHYPRNLNIMHNVPLQTWLHCHLSNPRSLQDLSCLRIRHQLSFVRQGLSILESVNSLPIPARLKDMLFLKNYCQIIYS